MQNKDRELFSFVILSYKNYHYIKDVLVSLFAQTYPNIELIISNDCSDDFNQEELADYIDKNKGENITNVIINNNETNLGTVQNIENARLMAHGEYIMYMAADDALYDENVLERYAEEFLAQGEDTLVVASLTAMCGSELDDIEAYAPDDDGVNAMRTFTPQQMYSRISHTFTIPTTSTAYRMKLYDVVGGYDTSYYIIEDATLYAKMCRMGINVYWIDDMIGARHRGGGISHGNKVNLSEAYRKYRLDEVMLYENDIIPNIKLLSRKDRKLFKRKYRFVKQAYYKQFINPTLPKSKQLQNKIIHFPYIIINMLIRVKIKAINLLPLPEFCKIGFGMAISGILCLILGNVYFTMPSFGTIALLIYTITGLAFTILHYVYRTIAIVIDAVEYILFGDRFKK
ncbi:MAG: glycosyltransferase family 2 protein [Oscillospiraceae bacterium]